MIFPSPGKKHATHKCVLVSFAKDVIDIIRKMLQPFRGEAGVQRNNFMFCQKVTFSNLSKMADRTSRKNALFQQGAVESIVSPIYVINHVRV